MTSSAESRAQPPRVDKEREYQYDSLGQVKSGKRYWSDTSAVAGEQFGYRFDDIGNRLTTESGGNEWGAGTRWSNATNSLLNQLTSRSVPSTFDVIRSATNSSTVTVNDQPTTRKGTFYRAELTAANATGPVYVGVTNLSVLNNGSSTNDLLRTETGNVFVPQSVEQFTYDVDGNLLTDGRWTYAWDGENRLVTITGNTNLPTAARLKVELGYDVQGRRTSKKVSAWNGSSYVAQSTNRFVYDGWNLLGELDVPSGTLVRSYAWGADLSGTTQGAGGVGGLLMTVIHTGTEAGTYFAAYDGNGNVVGLIRSSDGLARAEYEYGPFGEVIRASGPIAKANPFRFSTKFQDDETDLLYYGYRYYNAFTGRWLSRDPIGERGGLNLYAYTQNRPIQEIDPFGLTNQPGDFGWNNYSVQVFTNPSTGDNSSAYWLGLDWLTGVSPAQRAFSGDDRVAAEMKTSPEAAIAREKIRNALAVAGCKVGSTVPFSRNLGEEGLANFYKGFLKDVGGRNPSRAFMGSFSGDATVTRCFGCCSVVRFSFQNVAGWESATRLPPPYGYGKGRSFVEDPHSDILPKSILPDNYFGAFGGNVNLTVSWTELICPQNSIVKQ